MSLAFFIFSMISGYLFYHNPTEIGYVVVQFLSGGIGIVLLSNKLLGKKKNV